MPWILSKELHSLLHWEIGIEEWYLFFSLLSLNLILSVNGL